MDALACGDGVARGVSCGERSELMSMMSSCSDADQLRRAIDDEANQSLMRIWAVGQTDLLGLVMHGSSKAAFPSLSLDEAGGPTDSSDCT